MNYKGESLIPGEIGYFFVTLSFTAALLSLIAYFFFTLKEDGDQSSETFAWRKLGRIGFLLHGIAVVGIIATMFYLIYHHMFEYKYVWAHSSTTLPVKYMISSFWEGQEGSFLLWTFWHVVLGGVLIYAAKKWEGPVMTFMMLAQVTLASMLLGFEFGGFKIGSDPFILLRHDKPDAPIFQFENYLNMLGDGKGLNPLLRNYWMVIHPPVLFLGFAATIVPFAYAMAGLWKRKFAEWIKPALPWTHFALLVLGAGVLMGGAWAYEALSFGGFWAWDPVENAALVPWLLIVAGMHSMVIFKNRNPALKSTFIFIILGFLLVLYATFLTRSGVLGDSSVHSFTGLGLSGQLLVFIFIFFGLSAFLLVKRWKAIPGTNHDDKLLSREFWMYIGSLVLSLSALHIIGLTSAPIFNDLFGTNRAYEAEDYNEVQLPISVIILILSGFSQYLRYLDSKANKFFKQLLIIFVISLVMTGGLVWLTGMSNIIFIFLLFASSFGIAGNAGFMWPQVKKGKFRFTASSVSHIGFAMLLMGALISISQQKVISINKRGILFDKEADMQTQMQLKFFERFQPARMGNYIATYLEDSTSSPNTYYKIRYHKLDENTLDTVETFTLNPRVQKNENMGKVRSPDTRHYLTKDLFTYVYTPEDEGASRFQPVYDSLDRMFISKGGETQYKGLTIQFKGIDAEAADEKVPFSDYRFAGSIKLRVKNDHLAKTVNPLLVLKEKQFYSPPEELEAFNLKVQFIGIDPDNDRFELALSKGKQQEQDFLIMKAVIFPYINLLWLGCIVLTIGLGIGIYQRKKG